MAGFYIKRIIARSASEEDAIVEFTSGLNIIQGRSDTGKSCVLKCMEFVFGGNYDKLKNPFKKSSGYDSASVVIGTEQYGDVILSRKVGSGQVEVVRWLRILKKLMTEYMSSKNQVRMLKSQSRFLI